MNLFSNILIYGLLSGLATVAGIYLVLSKESWAKRNSVYLISFSAGVLLATAMGRLMPEALSLEPNALLWFLVSFIFFYIVEHGLILHSCNEHSHCEVHHPIDQIALIGMGLHSLMDGIIIGVGFEVSPSLGIIATISVLLHRLPDGIAMTSILVHSHYKRSKTLLYTWIVAMAAPVGAIASFFFLKNVNEAVLGIIVALAAGSFIYIAASDLIPEIHRKSNFANIVLVLLGAAIPFIVKAFLP